jgi:hypothetical protein
MKLTMCNDKTENTNVIDKFNRYDNLISIDFDDIITAVQCNEKEYTKEAVNRVFNEVLKTAMEDARHELKSNMDKILALIGE